VTPRWSPGDVIVFRDLYRGRPWIASPAIVVSDTPDLLVTYIAPGARFGFPASGPAHPWSHREAWEGHGALILRRPGDAYSVWVFWEGPQRSFWGWYVNFEAPYVRTALGIDCEDRELDLWSTDGLEWHWKDEEALDERVAEGRFTAAEATAIRTGARLVEADLRERGPWWDEAWAAWEPDPHWPVPHLPPGWDA
jgi:hypothetical protein